MQNFFLNALLIITMGSPKGFPRMGLEKKRAKKCREVDRKKNKCHHRWNFVSHFSWFLTNFVQFYGLRRPYMASNECPIDEILSPYNVAPMTGFHSILDALHDLRKPPHLLSGKCSFWKKGVIAAFSIVQNVFPIWILKVYFVAFGRRIWATRDFLISSFTLRYSLF